MEPSPGTGDGRRRTPRWRDSDDAVSLSASRVVALALVVVAMIVSIVVTRSNDGLKYLVIPAAVALGARVFPLRRD